jgi:multidrug efflux pump subunit AcrA (membrane-fusion protein)
MSPNSHSQNGSWFSRFRKRISGIALWKRIAFLLLPLILAAGGYAYYSLVYLPSQKTEEPTLQTTTAKRGDIVLYATGTGTLVPASESTAGFRGSGQIQTVYVKAGDEVEAGQLLAELDDTTQQIQLAQAKRALESLTSPVSVAVAKKDLAVALQTQESARKSLAYLISPDVLYWETKVANAEQSITQAETDAGANPSSSADKKIADAKTALAKAKISLAYVQSVYQQEYIPDNFTITEMDKDTRKWVTYLQPPTDAEIAEARAAYAESQLTVQEDQYYLDALQGKDVPPDAPGSGLTALEQARMNVTSAQYNVDSTKLYAPTAGTVTSLDAVVGETGGSSAVVTIQDLSQPYRLQVYLDESDWTQIKVGYAVEVTFDILSDKVFNGKVISVEPTLIQTAGTSVVSGMVQLDGSTTIALPTGTGATVNVIGGSAKNAVLVSIDALHEVSDGQYTVFVMENGKPKLRPVEIGLMDTVNAEVKSGLQEGDVVTTGIVEIK